MQVNKEKLINSLDSFKKAIQPSLLAIAGGLIVGFFFLLITIPGASFAGLGTLILGSFLDGISGVGDAFYKSAAIILTGLSVAFAFKTGLFNIGAAGQMLFAGAITILVGQIDGIPSSVHWIIALICGGLAGALWGFIPGLFKALFNINEVVSTIMMNYIAVSTSSILITKIAVKDTNNQAIVKGSAYLPKWGLDKLFNDPPTINISILIAILMAILIYFILNKTTLGYELKAVGYNKDASKYAGINEKRNIIISMSIAGALSGLAGACLYLSPQRMGVAPNLLGEGFIGITVALLANSNPIGIIFSGFFIAHISYGGGEIGGLGYQGEIASIVTACIVYFMGIAMIIQKVFGNYMEKRKQRKMQKINKEEER